MSRASGSHLSTKSSQLSTLRLGIAGVGNMGKYHAQLVVDGAIPGCRLAAICDTDPAALAAFPEICAFADSGEMIRSGGIDALLIATPHYSHTTIGIAALKAGLHLLVEKPLCVHKADCERLLRAHANPRQAFAVMLNQRTDP